MSSKIFDPEQSYRGCSRCRLHRTRRRIVFRGDGRVSRGTVERDGKLLYFNGAIQYGDEPPLLPLRPFPQFLLFIGEAPGETEDILGRPFVGDSGRLFNFMLSFCTTSFDFEITNVVACRPTTASLPDYKPGDQIRNRKPQQPEIEKCLPRVDSLVRNIPYTGYVLLGEVAGDLKVPSRVKLNHPAFILRQEYKLGLIKEFALKLDNYVKTLCEDRGSSKNGRKPS